MKQESNLKVIKNQFEQTAEEINNQEQFLSTNWLKQNTFNEEKIKNKVNKEPENNDLQSAWLVRQNLLNIQSQYGTQVAALERLVKNLKTEVKNLDSRHTAIEESIEKLVVTINIFDNKNIFAWKHGNVNGIINVNDKNKVQFIIEKSLWRN